jgi:hypothetical protein
MIILLCIAALCFLLALTEIVPPRVNLVSLGLFFWVIAEIIVRFPK